MSDALNDYLSKRAAVVAAEKSVLAMVKDINGAARSLGDPHNSRNSHPNWRDIPNPHRSQAQSRNQMYGSRIPNWPRQEEVLDAINEYWKAITAAEEAYAKLEPHQRDGVLPVP